MLLVHQAGSVKIGEVVRYTLTYTPSSDRIRPSPTHLYLRIKNSSAIAFRAAYLHGPYTLHVSAYPTTFNPHQRVEDPSKDGVPQFEPNLKAGSSFDGKLTIPDDIREGKSDGTTASSKRDTPAQVQWIIEIASQVLFSASATVHYELLVGRDERSLDLGFAAIAGKGHGEPGQIQDFRPENDRERRRQSQAKGVYSRAVELMVEDTDALWNKPALPRWDEPKTETSTPKDQKNGGQDRNSRKHQQPKKIHLVILTHGLHSNIGADMLYLKESIDATVKQARIDKKHRKASRRGSQQENDENPESSESKNSKQDLEQTPSSTAPLSGGQEDLDHDQNVEDSDDEDDEEVIVRGFPGNVVRTERGIQYLGKRLAKYILTLTYPDQPFLPESKSLSKTIAGSFSNSSKKPIYGKPSHEGSTIHKAIEQAERLPYTFTSISFVGHSLGGLVQTYAMAYIHKHTPEFFNKIKPVNFVCMASPLLGLSNENPLYVKFALDFGLVGRTGQDLGLTWKPPAIARSGWSAVIGGLGGGKDQQPKGEDPRAKPLLRILPTGPAHEILLKFRNRTVYSNVVNDGIVPLRTSCLLFLDWRGLDRVENARRENGLISTMASFGWNELTGANTATVGRPSTGSSRDRRSKSEDDEPSPSVSPTRRRSSIPQPFENTTVQDTSTHAYGTMSTGLQASQQTGNSQDPNRLSPVPHESSWGSSTTRRSSSPFNDFFNFFKPSTPRQTSPKPYKPSNKTHRTYRRAQVLRHQHHHSDKSEQSDESSMQDSLKDSDRPSAVRGNSIENDPERIPPPKTSVFEAAGDILNPPIPPRTWIIDPTTRSRTIFHDRIYHPDEIPMPPPKRSKFSSTGSLRSSTQSSQSDTSTTTDSGGMRVEEKIARAYHNELSWRKVLVRLEPDAHNNMIVRRMFANAYGWDVVKHVCDTHFSTSAAATTADSDEEAVERATDTTLPPTATAEEVEDQTASLAPTRTTSELREATDAVPSLPHASSGVSSSTTRRTDSRSRDDSAVWNDAVFEGSDSGADSDADAPPGPFEAFQRFWNGGTHNHGGQGERSASQPARLETRSAQGTSDAEIAEFLTKSPLQIEGHRGLGVDVVSRPEEAVKTTYEAETVAPFVPETGDGLVERQGRMSGELGLRKPPEARIRDGVDAPAVERRTGSGGESGVAETVAKLSVKEQGSGESGDG